LCQACAVDRAQTPLNSLELVFPRLFSRHIISPAMLLILAESNRWSRVSP
jgi:hypothetical protein